MVDLNQIVSELVVQSVVVEVPTEHVTFKPGATNNVAEFRLNIMTSFAQLERAITKERQADGIRAAKERGVYQGRARKLLADGSQRPRSPAGSTWTEPPSTRTSR